MRITATLAGAAITATMMALPIAPTAQAVPGDPMAGCETGIFQNYCDGPIREDGSWRRCLHARGQSYYAGPGQMGYLPPVDNCFMVPGADAIPAMPLGQPDHHIDQ